MSDLLREVTERECGRQRSEWGLAGGDEGVPGVTRLVAPIVADVLDILTREGRIPPAPQAGPCWDDSGIRIGGEHIRGETYRCELRAGHLGAHESERYNGTAVWPASPSPAPNPTETGE